MGDCEAGECVYVESQVRLFKCATSGALGSIECFIHGHLPTAQLGYGR